MHISSHYEFWISLWSNPGYLILTNNKPSSQGHTQGDSQWGDLYYTLMGWSVIVCVDLRKHTIHSMENIKRKQYELRAAIYHFW